MADLTGIYSAGTISVAAGGTTVTGVGTSFVAALIRAGDLFCSDNFSDIAMITETPTVPTSLKIEAWPGTALAAGSNYKIVRLSDAGRIADVMMEFVSGLATNVGALAGLELGANKGIYATGAGALGTFDQTPFGRAIQGLTAANGKIPVATGANTVALRDIVGTVSQSGSVPTGAIVERGSNANGSYVRFADGTQICWNRWSVTDQAISSPYGSSGLFTGSRTWSFPAAFSSIPAVFCTEFRWGTSASWGATGVPSLSATILNGYDFFSRAAGTATNISASAVGRWF